jgi:hypothetical protein
LRALRPGLLTIPGAKLLRASSPYSRRGALWDAYDRYYGKDARILVWRVRLCRRRTLTPSMRRIRRRLPPSMARNFGRIESFIGIEAVRGCITPSLRERPPERQWRYYGFVDPSGGSSDSMTLAVSHKEGATVILDAVREVKPPFSPEATVEEFARLLRQYRCTSAYRDRYAGEWPREQFKRHSINYLPADKSKSDIYLDFLPLVNSGGIDLLDNDRMLHQFVSLERRTSRGGRDSIDHPRGLHDDVANAIARTVVTAAQQPSGWRRDRLPKMPELTIVRRYSGGEPGTNWMSRK